MQNPPQKNAFALQIRLFGTPGFLRGDGELAVLSGRKDRALIAYLAVHPGVALARDRLVELIWPDAADGAGRASLRQSLSAIRKALGERAGELITGDRDTVILKAEGLVTDVATLEGLATESDTSEQVPVGEFLEGLSGISPAFDTWRATEQARLSALACKVLEETAGRAESERRFADAAALLTRALAIDPLAEATHRRMMEMYAAQSRADAALRQFRTLERLLETELGVRPEKKTLDLAREIRRRRQEGAARPPAAPTSDGPPPPGARPSAFETSFGLDLSLPEKPSVAMLPFANLSGDPDQDYFADGLTEDVIAQLARFRSLFVIGSTSSFAYKSRTPKVQDVGRELGVAYVIQGSVRKAGKRVRIAVELVEAETGRQLWADRYDRDLADIFAVQDEVAGKVVATLAGQIEDTGRRRAAGKRPNDLAAYELVLLGEQSEKEFTRDGVLRARALFQQAIERDPENARAHASMARSYLDELWSDWSADWDAAAAQAFDWAQKAVVLDGLDNRARVNLGVAHYHCKGNFEAAQSQFAKALELNPNDADAFCLRGRCHVYAGEGDEAIACTDKSMRLTPFDSNACNMSQFLAHYTARRYAEALASLERIVDPAYRIHAFLAACCAQLGRDAEARNAMSAYMAAAREEIAIWPGNDPKAWWRHWARSQPFRDPADLEHLLDGFRKAGMPI